MEYFRIQYTDLFGTHFYDGRTFCGESGRSEARETVRWLNTREVKYCKGERASYKYAKVVQVAM